MMASPLPASSPRSTSPAMSELRPNAPKSIDDLTAALQNFARTRSSSPDIVALGCCCQKDDCMNLSAWKDVKAKLESRLVLSAEVGQALLQRYEAFVKRQDAALSRQVSVTSLDTQTFESPQQQIESLARRLDLLTEENSIMESRIQELLIKTELSEATTRALQHELHESRTTVNKLTTQQSRSVAWELRLSQVTQERDDAREERDAALGRARASEIRARNNANIVGKSQQEVNTLKEELAALRASRNNFSQAVLQEAKSRLEILHRSLNVPDPFAHAHTARLLESLVADNEALKKDVSELNMLLDEARDELQEARERWDEETRVHNLDDTLDFGMRYPRDKSVQTDGLLLSNNNHLSHPAFVLPSPRPSVLAVESIGSSHSDTSSLHQFDREKLVNGSSYNQSQDSVPLGASNTVSAQMSSHVTANDFSAQDSQPLTLLTNALSTLLTRLLQTDARTLTLRLRKQHALSGSADPRSVSQATIKSILNDVAVLKLGRDSGLKWKVTRAEVKAVLRLFKDVFELACTMRATLNEVTFEPSMATRLKKEALAMDTDVNSSNGWIQKLFGQSGLASSPSTSTSANGNSSSSSSNPILRHPAPQRPSAKLAPAIGASTMTVNVLGPDARHGLVSADDILRASSPPALSRFTRVPTGVTIPVHVPTPRNVSLMGIFAGAPTQNPGNAEDQWVVLPRTKIDTDVNGSKDKGVVSNKEMEKKEPDRLKQLRGAFSNMSLSRSATLAPGKPKNTKAHLPPHMDESDAQRFSTAEFREPLLQRTLRPRGLSDSSIRTTFLREEPQQLLNEESNEDEDDTTGKLDKSRQPFSTAIYLSPSSMAPTPASSFGSSPPRAIPRPSSARPGIIRSLVPSSWVESSLLASIRDDSPIHGATWARRAAEGRDY